MNHIKELKGPGMYMAWKTAQEPKQPKMAAVFGWAAFCVICWSLFVLVMCF